MHESCCLPLSLPKTKPPQQEIHTEYLAAMDKCLSGVMFKDTAFCHVHGEQCALTPRATKRWRSCLWLDAAGSTCVAWSRAGKGAGHCHESSAVMLTWLAHRKYMQPDLVVHECSPAFPASIFDQLLNDSTQTALKCPWARDVADGCPDKWERQSLVISPRDLGVPASRERLYSVIVWQPFLSLPENLCSNFLDWHGRACIVDATVYFDVPLAALELDGRTAGDFGVLSGGDAARLEAYEVGVI